MKKNILLCVCLFCMNLAFGQIPLEVEGGELTKAASIMSTSIDRQVLSIKRDAKGSNGGDVLELEMDDNSSNTSQFIEAELESGNIVFQLNKDGFMGTIGRVAVGSLMSNLIDELSIFDVDNDGDAIIRTKQGGHEVVFGSNTSNEGIFGTTTNSRMAIRTNNVNRMIITSAGLVGIGTPGPEKKLHVREDGIVNDQTTVAVLESVVSKRPSLLFSEGGTQISNGMSIEYDGRLTGTSNNLRINTSAGDIGLMVRNNGHVGIKGSATNFATFRVNQAPGVTRGMEIIRSNGVDFWGMTVSTGNNFQLSFNGVFKGSFSDTNGNYVSVSDRRLKSNITPLTDDALDKVMALNPVSYTFKDQKGDKNSIGFIAQEVELIFPEMTHQLKADGQDIIGLSYSEFGVIAIKAIQLQQDHILHLEDELNQIMDLKRELIALKSEIKASLRSTTNATTSASK